MNMPNCPCSRCGSLRTERRNNPPQSGLLNRLKDMLDSLKTPSFRSEWGQKFVVCKDCGHVSIVQVM